MGTPQRLLHCPCPASIQFLMVTPPDAMGWKRGWGWSSNQASSALESQLPFAAPARLTSRTGVRAAGQGWGEPAEPGLDSMVLGPLQVSYPRGSPPSQKPPHRAHLPWSVALTQPLASSSQPPPQPLAQWMKRLQSRRGCACGNLLPRRGPNGNPGPPGLPGKNCTSGGETNRKRGVATASAQKSGNRAAELLVYNPPPKTNFPAPNAKSSGGWAQAVGGLSSSADCPEDTVNEAVGWRMAAQPLQPEAPPTAEGVGRVVSREACVATGIMHLFSGLAGHIWP